MGPMKSVYKEKTLNTVTIGHRHIAPSKIVCIGLNYVDHIRELGHEIPEDMVVFLKPNSAISAELHSTHHEPLHYEGELCFVFEKGRFSAVAFGLDLTKRELQSKLRSNGHPWERAKAFDGAAVFSHFVEISGIPPNLTIELDIDGKNVQTGYMDLMIHKPEEILAELLTFMSLNDGDIVMTGTPKGVGVIKANQMFVGKVKRAGEVIVRAEWRAK